MGLGWLWLATNRITTLGVTTDLVKNPRLSGRFGASALALHHRSRLDARGIRGESHRELRRASEALRKN